MKKNNKLDIVENSAPAHLIRDGEKRELKWFRYIHPRGCLYDFLAKNMKEALEYAKIKFISGGKTIELD